ncbi:MAG: APC family permease [Paracoccaceae bacterium]
MAAALHKRLGLGLLTAYGIGVMVGAGIYVLVGAAAGAAGLWAPLAFLLAGLVALPTALSYCELAARIPEAAGDSAYVEIGLGRHGLALLIGAVNILAGTIAAAAVLRGGVGYLTSVVPVPAFWAIVAIGAALTVIAILGVVESLAFAATMTVIEVVGLLAVSAAGFWAPPVAEWQALPALPPPHWPGVATAAIFAFFAFIGFDDLVNMAEEARRPERDMPRAILFALAITAVLYFLVSAAAVRAVPVALLGTSDRPLSLVWEVATGTSATFLALIAVAAALNGILAQIVMASRVIYGLGRRSPALGRFHRAHPRFGTPVLATTLIGAATVGAALTLPVATLAEVTSLLLLAVFATVNLALIGLKRRRPEAPFRVPFAVPLVGLGLSVVAFAVSLETVL